MSPSNVHIQPAAADDVTSPEVAYATVKRPLPRHRTNISRACLPCRQRKRKCTGNQPCSACDASGTTCSFDPTMDRRRRSYGEKARAESDFQRVLLDNLLKAIKTEEAERVLNLIRSNASLEELATELETINEPRRSSTCSTTSSDTAQLVLSRTLSQQTPASRESHDTLGSPGDSHFSHGSQNSYSLSYTPPRPLQLQQALPSFNELTANLSDPTLPIVPQNIQPNSPGDPRQHTTYHGSNR